MGDEIEGNEERRIENADGKVKHKTEGSEIWTRNGREAKDIIAKKSIYVGKNGTEQLERKDSEGKRTE